MADGHRRALGVEAWKCRARGGDERGRGGTGHPVQVFVGNRAHEDEALGVFAPEGSSTKPMPNRRAIEALVTAGQNVENGTMALPGRLSGCWPVCSGQLVS